MSAFRATPTPICADFLYGWSLTPVIILIFQGYLKINTLHRCEERGDEVWHHHVGQDLLGPLGHNLDVGVGGGGGGGDEPMMLGRRGGRLLSIGHHYVVFVLLYFAPLLEPFNDAADKLLRILVRVLAPVGAGRRAQTVPGW